MKCRKCSSARDGSAPTSDAKQRNLGKLKTSDANVRVAHSQRMDAALRKAGTPVEFLHYKELDHQLDDSEARTEMLTRIGLMLEKAIGH